MKKVFLKSILLLCALIVGSSSVWADATTTYSWNGNGSTTTGNETGGTATAQGGNSNVAVGSSQKGNYCFKINKKFDDTYYIEIALDEDLIAGDKVTIGGFRTSSSSATLGIDFGTSATQQTKSNCDYISAGTGTPTDWEVTVPAAAAGSSTIRLYRTAGSTGIYVSKLVVTTTATGEKATWSISPSSATVAAGKSTTLQLTTNYDGTLTFTSKAPGTATVSYDSSTKKITVNGIAAGSTEITASGPATATYKAINKTIGVTVQLDYNYVETIEDLGYQFWDEITSSGGTATTINGRQNGISVNIVKANGNNPRADGDYVRLYKQNEMTITAPSGTYLTKIVFTEPSANKSWAGSMTVSAGEYVDAEKAWYADEEDITSVTLTGTDDAKRIGGMEVYLMVANKSVTPSQETDKHYATFFAQYKAKLPTGITAYIGTYSAGILTLHVLNGSDANTIIPANTPVVLKATSESSISIEASMSTPSTVQDETLFTANILHGTLAATEAPANAYVLGYAASPYQETGFYQFSGTIPANRAYLIIDNGEAQAAGIRIVESESNATNVENIEANDEVVKFIENGQLLIKRDGITYDALGRKIR